MQKWEYLELEVAFTRQNPTKANGHLWYFKQDGKHFENSGPYSALISQLGVEGWELVASNQRLDVGITGVEKVIYIFKRPMN